MPPIILANARLRAAIIPELGAGLADFSILGPLNTWYPLMRRAAAGEANASLLASFFMAPWVNRIASARFAFAGREHVLQPTTPKDTPPHLVVAQHGDVRKRPWRTLRADASSAALEFDSREHERVNWPWPFRCAALYTLTSDALAIDLSVTNLSGEPFPAGCGHHPYFPRRLFSDAEQLRVRVPATARYPLSHALATAHAAPDALADRLRTRGSELHDHTDALFLSERPEPNAAQLHWPQSGVALSIEASDNLRHWIVYAPIVRDAADQPVPLPFVAVEPQSQPNDALNRPELPGTAVLAPGETLATRVVFRIASLG